MTDLCENCSEEITDGGILKRSNLRLESEKVELVNFFDKTNYLELCDKCGSDIYRVTKQKIDDEIQIADQIIKKNIQFFPMITLGEIPLGAKCKLKNLITANITVGTGVFNEFSQGFSDFFGTVNSETGMAYKVNSGEAVARSILAGKAMSMGANCILGVDIDYGTTANNAATINMQGTAAVISNLAEIIDAPDFAKATMILDAYRRLFALRRQLQGDFQAA